MHFNWKLFLLFLAPCIKSFVKIPNAVLGPTTTPITVRERVTHRVSTGIPGYNLHTKMILNFFPISIMEEVLEFLINSRTTFLSVNQKFPEPCTVIPERSTILFPFMEKLFQNFPWFWKNIRNLLNLKINK